MRKYKKVIGGIIFLFLLLIIILAIAYFLDQAQIRKVYIVSPKPVYRGLNILNDKNLFIFPEEQTEEYLKRENIEVKTVSFEKIFPNSLIIHLTLRRPSAIIETSSGKLVIDQEAKVLPVAVDNLNLPIIAASANLFLDEEKIDWRIVKALSLLDNSSKQGILVDRISIDGDKTIFQVYLSDGAEIIIPAESDMAQIAASLQIIISRFRIEGKIISKIDYQFDKPTIIFGSGKVSSSQ